MKKILLSVLLLASFFCQAQDTTTVAFVLDTLRSDSFFLQVSTTFKPQGQARGNTLTEDVFFSDTLSFNLYISAWAQKLADLEKQKNQFALTYNAVSDQVTYLTGLRDSIFRGESPGLRGLRPPPPEFAETALSKASESQSGPTWVVFAATPNQVIKLEPGVVLESDAVILNPDGSVVHFKKPKKKKPK